MLDIPQILLTDAAEAADAEFNTLRNWIAQGVFKLSPHDKVASGRGGRYILTLRTVYGLAVMRALTKYGLSPKYAANSAQTYTDRLRDKFGATDRTFLVINHPPPAKFYASLEDQEKVHASRFRIVDIQSTHDYANLFEGKFTSDGSCMIIDCNLLRSFVDGTLSRLSQPSNIANR